MSGVSSGAGIGTYFNFGRIRIRHKTMEYLGFPEYIHLKLNEEKKYLFIEGCKRDMDAFRIRYDQVSDGKKVRDPSCYINSVAFLDYLAGVIGVSPDSPSLRFKGQTMPDGTVFIDLNHYEIIGRTNSAKRIAPSDDLEEE